MFNTINGQGGFAQEGVNPGQTQTNFLGALGGGGGGYAGAAASIIGGFLDYNGQRDANRANAKQAQQQMDFQERMSSTAYQRATQDMYKAGINPMLAYSQGGASAPAGASASMQSASLGDALHKGVGSAMEITRLNRENKETDSRIGVNELTKIKLATDADLNIQSAKASAALTAKTQAETGLIPVRKGLLGAQTNYTKERGKTSANTNEKYGIEKPVFEQQAIRERKDEVVKDGFLYRTLNMGGDLFNKFTRGASSAVDVMSTKRQIQPDQQMKYNYNRSMERRGPYGH